MPAKAYLPHEAEIVERIDDAPEIFTLRLRFTDPKTHEAYRFRPGQFNMLYLYGVGEVPISIVSDPEHGGALDHTIREVGRVTGGLAKLGVGDRIGIRGPYGRGWPMNEIIGKDILVITGGLGCAPSVSVINYVMQRRSDYGRLTVMQGVKHHSDLLWRERYEQWARQPDTQILLASDSGGPLWPWHTGPVTVLFDKATIDPERTAVVLCGPQPMMQAAIQHLLPIGIPEEAIWLSMERNMQCAVGHCGHCQYGPKFICRDGPVFAYPALKGLFGLKGF